MGTALGDSVMAFSGVVGAICRNTGNVLIGGRYTQKLVTPDQAAA